MRPKLRGDTFYIPIPDGVYLRNNQKIFQIKGKVVYRWLERLAPYLDGQHTLEELTADLPAEKQAMVSDLVNILLLNGFLKDVAADRPHTLGEAERQLYAREIAFIDSFVDSAAYRFEQFRENRILLIGSGLTFAALVRASLRVGVRQLAVCPTEEGPVDWQHYHDYLHLQNQQGARQELFSETPPVWEDEGRVAALLQRFDAIVSASDQPCLDRTRLLNRLCKEQQKLCIQAVIIDDHAWIGPLIHPESEGCWECAWHRLLTNLLDPGEQLARYTFPESGSRFIALPTAAVVSNILTFELFKHLTDIQHLETEKRILAIDLETLSTTSHPFLPHPYCRSCSSLNAPQASTLQETVRELEQGASIDLDAFSRQMAGCFDNKLGLLNSLTEEDFVQVPLNISQSTISNPMVFLVNDAMASREKDAILPSLWETGRLSDRVLKTLPEPLRAIGVGTSVHIARQRATLRGCELYAVSIIGRTQLLKPDRESKTQPIVRAEWLTADVLSMENDLWTWAWDLQAERACLVPAPLVYPGLRGLAAGGKTAPGLASGLTWTEAISRALLKLCKDLTLLDIACAQKPFPQVDLAALPLDDEGVRYRQMLELIGELPQIYDVTGPLGIPTFAFCQGSATITYVTHLDLAEAMRTGLEQVVQHYQARVNQQPDYALPAVPALPVPLRGHGLQAIEQDMSLDWPALQSHLQHVLAEQGWQPFVVPLHGDPVLTTIMPYIVHALLARIPS